MPEPYDRDCLSFGDSLFLHLEREGVPLHVATLSTFERQIPLQDCIRYIEAKLPLIPRYRQRVVSPPMDLGHLSWQYDGKFDVRNHVREVTLRTGSEAELRSAASRILSITMDRSRPLWDMTLFRGLKGNRTGVLTRVHHSMADGVSGVGLMTVLMDPSPEPPVLGRGKPMPRRAKPQPQSVLGSLVECCLDSVQRVLSAESQLLSMAEHLAAAAQQEKDAADSPAGLAGNSEAATSMQDLDELLPEFLAPAERLPFNIVCRGPQKFACAEIPLADLKAAKHACGATINDVVLALVTSAVRRYVRLHKLPVRGRDLRIVVPVSLRSRAEMKDLGNRITFIPVTVPMGHSRLRACVRAVHQKVAALRNTPAGALVGLAGTLLGAIPAPFQAVIGRIASQLPLSVCNLICTNVPGPKVPLYLLGHRMISCHPYVPIGGEMGMNCAVLTYNGTAYFGFTGDVNAVRDIELFPRFLRASFAELQRELGLSARSRRARSALEQRPEASQAAPSAKAAGPPPLLGFPKKAAPRPKESQQPEPLHAAS